MQLVFRNGVSAFEIDQQGHLNVQFYAIKAAAGLTAFANLLGVTPSHARETHQGLRMKELHLRFLREQFSGAPLSIYAGVLDIGENTLRIYEEFQNTHTGEPAATFTKTVELVDMRTQRPLPLPQSVKDKAAEFICEQPAHGRPRGVQLKTPRPAPTIEEAERLGMQLIYQDVARANGCDAYGHVTYDRYIDNVYTASSNFRALTGTQEAKAKTETRGGGAVMEYHWAFHTQPRVGDIIVDYAGLSQIEDKTNNMVHWFFNLETGEPAALGEYLVLNFDMETRRPLAFPPERRAAMEKNLIPGLSV